MPEQKIEDKFLVSLSDITSLFKKNKWKIISFGCLTAFLGLFYSLTRPIRYESEGTFRERSIRSGQVSSFAQMFLGDGFNSSSDNEAQSLIKSRKLMRQVIKNMNLQAELFFKCNEEGVLKRVKNNLKIEWAKFKNKPYPVLVDPSCLVLAENIAYDGEVPIFLDFVLEKDNRYKILEDKKQVGFISLGEKFGNATYSFSLKRPTSSTELPKEFKMVIWPIDDLATKLSKILEIGPQKNDKSVLMITYQDRDRHFAAKIVNNVMENYQDYLQERHDYEANIQMDYLERRRNESIDSLKKLMKEHAEFLSSDATQMGFIDSRNEMDFLVRSQHDLKEKLLANELEIKRLNNLKPNQYAHFDQYSYRDGNPANINTILSEIRNLKQERDRVELAIKSNNQFNGIELEDSFHQQLSELKKVQQQKQELEQIARFHQTGEPYDPDISLLQDPRFLVVNWMHKLISPPFGEETESDQAQKEFLSYLNNLKHLFNVHEKIIHDRLTHQQKTSDEYLGINLNTAHELYLEYSKRLNDEESKIRQTFYFLKQMEEDPGFEISSLSSLLTDHVSNVMITRSSEYLLQLKDEKNQSLREQTRLKQELELQKTFLILHLKQVIKLMELNKKLYNEKIYALQNAHLELVHQQISLLEKNLDDYVKSRLDNLEQERLIVHQHLKDIQREMAALPQKWVAERLIEQQVDTNQSIVKEIAKIVESKTISHNLDIIQSSPIDLAIAPIHPKAPSMLAYALIGGFFGVFAFSGFILARSLKEGISVSSENLRGLGFSVAGRLSPESCTKHLLGDSDLNTLRRINAYFELAMDKSNDHTLLLIEGRGPDYSENLAHLFFKKGWRVLLLDLDFDRSMGDNQRGLLQYLEGEIKEIPIISTSYGDYISSGGGGQNRFVVEIVSSELFLALLEKLKKEYDCIIAVSHALPISAEAEGLCKLFSNICLSMKDETVDELDFYLNLKEKNPLFTLYEPKKV